MDRGCNHCGKVLKNLGGRSRHEKYCKTLRGKQLARKGMRFAFSLTSSQISSRLSSNRYQGSEDAYEEASGEHSTYIDDDEWADIPRAIERVGEADREGGILRTTNTSIRVETYGSTLDEAAGQPMQGCHPTQEDALLDDVSLGQKNQHSRQPYHPFKNATDYALAHYFLCTQSTNGDMNAFLKDDCFKHWHAELSFTNADQCHDLIHQIPDAISNEPWKEEVFADPDEYKEVQPTRYAVKFQNIMRAIRFLIGHRPFAPNLNYAPIRLYNNDNISVTTKCIQETGGGGLRKTCWLAQQSYL